MTESKLFDGPKYPPYPGYPVPDGVGLAGQRREVELPWARLPEQTQQEQVEVLGENKADQPRQERPVPVVQSSS
jgi:hypothetical protein